MLYNLHNMATLAYNILRGMDRFQHWFDRRFGWFFTNGMKERMERGS
jgi:hypothetical protein